jgi:hypothetical protein
VFGRSKAAATKEAAASTATDGGGKGRPTPKRREAEKGRRRAVTAPANRKDAAKAVRERSRGERAQQMAALKAGDERNLPPRDRGPVRKYARDLVDSRRSVAEFFLPFALVILVLTFAPDSRWKAIGSTLWLVLVVLIIVDSIVMAMRLRRGLRKSLPDQPSRGALAYAMMRSMQIRRFRLPPPRVRGGRRRS